MDRALLVEVIVAGFTACEPLGALITAAISWLGEMLGLAERLAGHIRVWIGLPLVEALVVGFTADEVRDWSQRTLTISFAGHSVVNGIVLAPSFQMAGGESILPASAPRASPSASPRSWAAPPGPTCPASTPSWASWASWASASSSPSSWPSC